MCEVCAIGEWCVWVCVYVCLSLFFFTYFFDKAFFSSNVKRGFAFQKQKKRKENKRKRERTYLEYTNSLIFLRFHTKTNTGNAIIWWLNGKKMEFQMVLWETPLVCASTWFLNCSSETDYKLQCHRIAKSLVFTLCDIEHWSNLLLECDDGLGQAGIRKMCQSFLENCPRHLEMWPESGRETNQKRLRDLLIDMAWPFSPRIHSIA